MDIAVTETQKSIQKQANEFLEKECPISLVRQMENDELGYSPGLWKDMANVGWMGLTFPDEYGGDNTDFLDLIILLEEMGKFLVPGPFIPTMVSGLAIAAFGREEQKKALLPKIARGELIFSLALYEPPGLRLDEDSIVTRAEPCEGGFSLIGSKTYVPDFEAADKLLCVARTAEGTNMFILDTGNQGVRAEPLITIAYDKRSDVFLEKVTVTQKELLGREGQGGEIMDSILKWGACALSAYAVGAAQKSLDLSLEYAKQREQFGGPIASFQVIQHKLVDMLVAIEEARLLTYQAAWRLSQKLPADMEVSAAKARAGESYDKVTSEAMRIFSAMGSTKECDIQLYYRRVKPLQMFFGDSNFHQHKIAELMRQ
jgi:alkylation response protein AidB-like acyl-CoA dehydrogenase